MIKKLKTLYPNLIVNNKKPEDYFGHYHWFSIEFGEWIGIPKEDLLDNQLVLLKSLLDYYQTENNSLPTSSSSQKWYQYLFENGTTPIKEKDVSFRLIYFQWSNVKINLADFEQAIKAFFESDITIVWENEFKGIIIEPKIKHILSENDFLAIFETIKSDFYIEPYFYFGKFRLITEKSLPLIQFERALFDFSIHSFKQDRLFHFEKVVPQHLASHLPDSLKAVIQQDILPVLKEDEELFFTIKSFLQNNMNASNTSKNLFIHRNTLQYRLDKFTEKTGIPLKDFHSAMTVFIACSLYENSN